MALAEASVEEKGSGAAHAAARAAHADAGGARPRADLAISLVCRGYYAGALDACGGDTGTESRDAAVHAVRGFALHGLGRRADALGAFDRAIEIDPLYGAAHLGRARALMRLGRSDDAMGSFHEAARIDPGSATARAHLALVAVRLGCYDNAASTYESAIRLSPGDGSLHAGLAFALAGLGRFDDAWASCGRAAELSPASPHPCAARGRILVGQGRHADALAAFDKAVALDPASASAHAGRGLALSGLDRHADALAAFDKAVALDPASASAHAGRGLALEHLGRLDEAGPAFERAIGIDRHHELAKAGRRRLDSAGGSAGAADGGPVIRPYVRAADGPDPRGTAQGGRGHMARAAILGRTAQADCGKEFDHAGGGIESLLRKRTVRGPPGQDHGGGNARNGCAHSPPLTAEEMSDIREVFAGGEMAKILTRIGGGRRGLLSAPAAEGGAAGAASRLKYKAAHKKRDGAGRRIGQGERRVHGPSQCRV